ncbi:hypothetical protein [Frankia gtarii]|uniref:hypothetical protein n=1 Tax=Frankia gtarii TaxID=2950102 RepID=UPI0034D66B11
MRDVTVDEAAILDTVRALEAADAPLRPHEWRALDDQTLRAMVGQRLQLLGRQLITVTDGEGGPVQGYISGWSDDVAVDLAEQRPNLQSDDLAVLALIYLRTEILQRVLGEDVPSVLAGLADHTGIDGRDALQGNRLTESLRRLRAHQLITPLHYPGPALLRLSPAQRQRLEENLVLLLRPDSIWARDIRVARRPSGTPQYPS